MTDLLAPVEEHLVLPTPITNVTNQIIVNAGCSVHLKRDDLIHPAICGNKWRKLKYCLLDALIEEADSLLSFGGAYSNHLIALAESAEMLGIPSHGLIRSYSKEVNNATVEHLKSKGMRLSFLHPKDYNQAMMQYREQGISKKMDNCYVIPQGGATYRALTGIEEMMDEVTQNGFDYTHILCAIGTGTTVAGIYKWLNSHQLLDSCRLIGISPFKGEVNALDGFDLVNHNTREYLEIVPHTSNSRFGARDRKVISFIETFKKEQDVILDPIYTGKMLHTTIHLLQHGYFHKGSKLLLIHTGGLQGIEGFNEKYNENLPLQ